LSLDGALPKSGGRISQNLMRNKAIGAMA